MHAEDCNYTEFLLFKLSVHVMKHVLLYAAHGYMVSVLWEHSLAKHATDLVLLYYKYSPSVFKVRFL